MPSAIVSQSPVTVPEITYDRWRIVGFQYGWPDPNGECNIIVFWRRYRKNEDGTSNDHLGEDIVAEIPAVWQLCAEDTNGATILEQTMQYITQQSIARGYIS